MIYLCYNPYSRNGDKIDKIYKRLSKKDFVKLINLVEFDDVNILPLINRLNEKDNAKVVIASGDGTLNRIVNRIKDYEINKEIYLYKAGTGNDFRRSLKEKGKLINITKYLKNLPMISFDGKEELFLNGVGMGLDADVATYINTTRNDKSKSKFFKATYTCMKEFKPFDIDVEIDGNKFNFKKCSLVSVLNAEYMGGGMKFCPGLNRLDKRLGFLVIRDVSKIKLFFLFPLIYLGFHTIFRKNVSYILGNKINIRSNKKNKLQVDGEHHFNVDEISVKI